MLSHHISNWSFGEDVIGGPLGASCPRYWQPDKASGCQWWNGDRGDRTRPGVGSRRRHIRIDVGNPEGDPLRGVPGYVLGGSLDRDSAIVDGVGGGPDVIAIRQ